MSLSQIETDTSLGEEAAAPTLQFPLAFTPFERLMLLDDQPDYPMTIHVELGFSGVLEREPFLASVKQAVELHPLLGAKAQWRGRWPYWVGRTTEPVPITWNDAEPPLHPMRPQRIDIKRGPGVHVHVYAGKHAASVLILLHHSCCDGQGTRRFVYDLLSAYDRLASGERNQRAPARLDTLRQDKLMARHEFAAQAARPVESEVSNSLWQRTRHALGFVLDRPEPLTRPRKVGSVGPSPVHNYLFDPEETANFRRRAQEEDVTFNDLAVAKLMKILVEWNRKHGTARDQHFVRVCVPTDLRVKSDDSLPATNRMGYAFLTRRFRETDDWKKLLTGVRDETTYIKDNRVGLDFVTNVSLAQKIPLVVPAFLRLTRSMTTSTLTNLGDATRRFRRRFSLDAGRMVVGGSILEFSHVTPPVRPGTRAGFGMVISSGRLSVSLLTDPHGFGDDDTQALLDSYVDELRTWNRGSS